MCREKEKVTVSDEKLKEAIKKFKPIDDTFMRFLFKKNRDLLQYVITVILREIGFEFNVLKYNTQESFPSVNGSKSCVLDLFAQSTDNKFCAIEIQKDDAGAVVLRASFIQNVVGSNILKKGQKHKNTPYSFIIFITKNDFFKSGLPYEVIRRRTSSDLKTVKDRSYIIYVNSSYRNSSTELGRLMHDFNQSDPDSMYPGIMKDSVYRAKNNERKVNEMCDVMKELMREDRRIARQEKRELEKKIKQIETQRNKAQSAHKREKKQSDLNFDIAVKMAYDSFCDGRYTLNEAADKLNIKPELLRKRFDRLSTL